MRGKFIPGGGFGRLDTRKRDSRSSRVTGRPHADDLFAPGRVRSVVCLSNWAASCATAIKLRAVGYAPRTLSHERRA